MARQYEGKVQLIGVAGRDSVSAMRGFVERHGLGFVPHAADPDGALWAHLGVRAQPTWVFINGGDGESTTEFGELAPDDLRQRFDALLAA